MHKKAETALRHEIYFNIGRKIIKEYRPKNKKGVRTEGCIFVLQAGMNARVTKCAFMPAGRHNYFPMQNSEKISLIRSSLTCSPVISPRAS